MAKKNSKNHRLFFNLLGVPTRANIYVLLVCEGLTQNIYVITANQKKYPSIKKIKKIIYHELNKILEDKFGITEPATLSEKQEIYQKKFDSGGSFSRFIEDVLQKIASKYTDINASKYTDINIISIDEKIAFTLKLSDLLHPIRAIKK